MLTSWKFWAVMGAILGLTALLALGFGFEPKIIPSPLVGKAAPAFSIVEMNTGVALDLASLEGTPFLLNFWASWCVACREEAHVLEAAHQEYGQDPKRFRVIGIAIQDELPAARAFARRFGKTYYLALDDKQGTIGLNYGLYGVPESFFVDAEGVIRYKQIGAVTPAVIAEQVQALLRSAP